MGFGFGKQGFDKWEIEFSMLQSQIYLLKGNGDTWSIFELYKPCNNQAIIIRKLITFSQGMPQVWNKKVIWERRKDLSGCNVRVVYINTAHLHEVHNLSNIIRSIDDTNNCITQRDPKIILQANGKSFAGLDREVFKALHSTLNFSIIWAGSRLRALNA